MKEYPWEEELGPLPQPETRVEYDGEELWIKQHFNGAHLTFSGGYAPDCVSSKPAQPRCLYKSCRRCRGN